MNGSSPATARNIKISLRRDEEKGRAFERGKTVRVVSETGFFLARLDSIREAEQIRRLLAAPNAVPVLQHGGALVAIRLMSLADDRCHAGERHGNSKYTTERVRNDSGQYVGTDTNLQHKKSCATWGDVAMLPVGARNNDPIL